MLKQRLLTLSDLRVIGPERVNPHAAEAERLTEAYCRELGIWLPHFQEYANMTRYLHPDATLERMVTIAVIYNFLYYIDDIHASDRSDADEGDDVIMQDIYKNCIMILKYGQMPEDKNPLYATCKVIREFILKQAPEGWLQRVVNSLAQHLKVTTLGLQSIITDGTLDLDKYILMREYDSGMHSTIVMIELEMGIFLPDEVIAHPSIQQMRICTMRLGGLVNDLFSYHKEVILNGQRFNLVNVLMENRKMSFDEAVDESIKMLNGFTDTFLALEQQLPDFGSEKLNHDVRLYVQGLRNEILATYHWQMSTNRYRSPDSPFPELRVLL